MMYDTVLSSVIVDYLALDRPIHIFFPDVEEYEESRGFNDVFKALIYPHVTTDIQSFNSKWLSGDYRLQSILKRNLYTHNDNILSDVLDSLGIE